MLRTPSIFILALAALLLGCPASKNPDAGMGGGTGGMGGGTGGGNDGGSDGGQDAGPPGLTCNGLLLCDQVCGGNACTDGCYTKSTAVAQGLFNALDDCISNHCSSMDGGPCVDSSAPACATCNESAATGPCISNLASCEEDMTVGPPNPDGGVVVPDAGQKLNCGGLEICQANCPTDGGNCLTGCTDQSTPEAIALQGVLEGCLAMACPSTDGGPCAMPGLACSGCREQVTLAQPNTCAAPYVACNGDTSNLPDGGASGPVSLVDGGQIFINATGLDQAASNLIVHDGYLYFTQVVDGSPVLRIRIGDDAGYSTLGPPQPTPVSVAVDDNNVYVWSVGTFPLNSSNNNSDGTLVQIPLDGGTALTLSQGIEVFYDAPYLNAVAVDSQNVYWVAGAKGNDGTIMKTAIGTANPVVLFSNQQIPEALVTDGINVYWGDWGTFDTNGRSNNDGTVWQGSIDGGTPTRLASNQKAPTSIAVDGTNVYWVNIGALGADNFPAPNSGSVMKVPIGGGAVTTIASSQAVPVSIVVDQGTVYWSEYGFSAPGLIMSAPNQGSSVVPLVAGLPDPAAVVVSGGLIYWTNLDSSPTMGSIWSFGPLP